MKKRLLIIVLAMCMALALLPSTVFATNDIIIASGECGAQGNNLTWTLGSDGTLTISGTGKMADNINDDYSPWRSNREKIKVVAIEDGITSIGILAFSECSSLAEITIPDSVASIGGSAFWRCSSLTTITIPDGVTSIRSGTFDGCSSLTTITIPDSVTSIEGSAFWGCNKLASVSVGENNRRYKSVDNVVFDKACEQIILYPAGKFETSYTIPDSVTSIGDSAFYGCSSLTTITIPDGVTSIGYCAFSGCSGLTDITIPDGVTSIGYHMFSGCSGLTDITIPDSVTSIGSSAFWGCSSLTDITIPDSVTSIDGDAFSGCLKLASISVGENNPSYKSVDNVIFDKVCEKIILYPAGKSETSYIIPDSVTSIESWAFYGCISLTSITIPDSVTFIGSLAFDGCRSLTDITIPDGVTSIGYRAFFDCRSLTDITIPDSVTSIGDDAFSGCSSLTDITIPDSVTSIGSSAFWGCSSLTAAYIPRSVTEIGSEPVQWCIKLKDIYFGGTEKEWNALNVMLPDNGNGYPIVHFEASIVTYYANGGTGTMADTFVGASEMYTFPACGFTAPAGKEFKAWQINGEEYAHGITYTITANTTITAVWQTISTVEYTLTGIITGHKGVTYTSVTAQLVGQDGSAYPAEVGAGVVDKTEKTEYAYTVSAPAGQYNLNVTATTAVGIVVNRTAVVNLTGDGQTQNINLPNGQASSNGSSSGNSSNSNYSISIPTNTIGGTVTVSPTNARAGATVTITASPNKGYELESIVVKDSKGNSIAVTEVGNGKYTFTMPSSSVSVDAAFVAATPVPFTTFIDVEPGAYYADAVAWAVENGITSGTGDGKFSPNEPCTRAQIVTFLWRAAGCPEVDITTTFTDVAPGSYYEMAVAWAVANGITNGAGDGKFSPNEPCTRAQAVTFLYRAKGSPAADESSFSDVESGLWYTDAVSWAVANGITNGTGDGRFSPDDICARGQIVTFLYLDMV